MYFEFFLEFPLEIHPGHLRENIQDLFITSCVPPGKIPARFCSRFRETFKQTSAITA